MSRVKILRLVAWLILLAPVVNAAAQTPEVWRDDGDVRSLLLALDRQERYLRDHGAATLRIGDRQVPKGRVLATVRELRKLTLAWHGRPEFAQELARRFEVVVASRDALFTAYHTPLLRVADRAADGFRVPILGRPRDLVEQGGRVRRRVGGSLVTPPTRAQILDGAYDPQRLAVAWTDDPVEFYYAQIQGGALAVYPDGRRRTLIYGGNNGFDYVSVEPEILKQVPEAQRPGGYLGLREYLRRHPAEADRFFRLNPRYIFFRLSDEPPMGLAHLPLTAKRSIATDKRYYSAGLVGAIAFPEPIRLADGRVETPVRYYLVTDADTGAAIKGPARVDFYFGEGPAHELFPTGIKTSGSLAYLLLNTAAPQRE
jgi:membrane-bound lytic murein transglycosylase A